MYKLNWIRVQRFRQVQSGTELRFHSGMNVVLGKNGTGKTTLLDLIGAVVSVDFRRYAGEEVDVSWEVEQAGTRFHWTVENRRTQPGEQTSPVPQEPTPFTWLARVTTFVVKDTGVIRHGEVRADQEGIFNRPPRAEGEVRFSSRSNDVNPFSGLSAHNLPKLARGDLRNERGLEYVVDYIPPPFRGHWRFPEDDRWLTGLIKDIRPVLMGTLTSSYVLDSPPVPKSIQEAIYANFHRSKEPPRRLSLQTGEQDTPEALTDILNYLKLRKIVLELELDHHEFDSSFRMNVSFYKGMTIWITRQDGKEFKAEALSHGQKRMLGFLWYLACSPDIVIADELNNGMHWSMAREAMDLIGERQAFLAIQDGGLLDHLVLDSAEHVERAFVTCKAEMQDGVERWIWSGVTSEQAENVYQSYKVGFQHVHEILRDWGIW